VATSRNKAATKMTNVGFEVLMAVAMKEYGLLGCNVM
jgi:hypothetical protein